eukprot:2005776-Rhodomonas_salina.1
MLMRSTRRHRPAAPLLTRTRVAEAKACSQAGSAHVVDLHGRNDEVTCLACATTMPRHAFHTNLLEPLNPAWAPSSSSAASASTLRLRPDGDAALETSDFSSFRVPGAAPPSQRAAAA